MYWPLPKSTPPDLKSTFEFEQRRVQEVLQNLFAVGILVLLRIELLVFQSLYVK